MIFKIKGFPTEISEPIPTPNIGELLRYPVFSTASDKLVLREGSEFQKQLLQLAPLRRTKKYITIVSQVQYLRPDTHSTIQRLSGYDSEWHIDSSGLSNEESDIIHLFLSDCSSLTEFNEEECSLDTTKMDSLLFRTALNDRRDEIGLKPKRIPPCRFVTFTNHVHRAPVPIEHEFRFMFRILESDSREPNPLWKSKPPQSSVYGANGLEPSISYANDTMTIHMGRR